MSDKEEKDIIESQVTPDRHDENESEEDDLSDYVEKVEVEEELSIEESYINAIRKQRLRVSKISYRLKIWKGCIGISRISSNETYRRIRH